MKTRIQGIVIGALAMALLVGGIAAAAPLTRDIRVTYRNIKLVIDGTEVTPKNVNGDVVEPFIYEGTIYLPLRAIGEALGKTASWDPETSTAFVVSEPSAAPTPHPPDTPHVEITYGGRHMDDISIKVGERVPLRVRIEPAGGDHEIVWSSSNTDIFEVIAGTPDENSATITGISIGSGTLTVNVGGAEATCTVRVINY